MKKLALKAQTSGGIKMLSKDQMKKVSGGAVVCGTGERRCCCGTSCICTTDPDCSLYPCCGRVWC